MWKFFEWYYDNFVSVLLIQILIFKINQKKLGRNMIGSKRNPLHRPLYIASWFKMNATTELDLVHTPNAKNRVNTLTIWLSKNDIECFKMLIYIHWTRLKVH